ncbi:small GTP-binding protein [Histomonas meleagridis]|uniref:small GTP-binding protein n=1 Tax=Histomonas meleagridis TaxID=135588 RepID=UPI00355A5BCF|nr:small GTP-binding protein [Histomonas meleagridis]KAH0797214.1 small GTP-binding protein [Histomonas meleagridis]
MAEDRGIKVVLIGDPAVGKSCIANRAVTGVFNEEMEATLGASYISKVVTFNDKEYKLQIWDTAGQEKFRGLTPLYFRGANVALIVYAIDNIDSFHAVEKWLTRLRESADKDVRIFLVANKIDNIAYKVVESDEGQELAEKIGATFYEVSAKTGQGVDDLFAEIPEAYEGQSNSEQNSQQTVKIDGKKSKKHKSKLGKC